MTKYPCAIKVQCIKGVKKIKSRTCFLCFCKSKRKEEGLNFDSESQRVDGNKSVKYKMRHFLNRLVVNPQHSKESSFAVSHGLGRSF